MVDNAIKHTPREGTVTIRGRHTAPETVEISMLDTGPGITKEQLPHVFERFYHGDGPGERPGTGLGLATCKEIVERLGGHMTLDSEPGHGAAFNVWLLLVSDR